MKFYLVHPQKQSSSIYVDVNFKKLRVRIATGLVVPSSAWDHEKQRVTNKAKNYIELNNQLKFINGQVDQYISNLKINRINLPIEQFETELQSMINLFANVKPANEIKPENTPISFFREFDAFVELRRNSENYSKSTLARYGSVIQNLKDFEEYSGSPISFESINNAFYENLVDFLRKRKKMVNNSIGCVIKILRTFLNYALDNNLTDNRDFQKKGSFKIFKEKADTIALTKEEVQMIADVPLQPKLDKVRNLFLLQIVNHSPFLVKKTPKNKV